MEIILTFDVTSFRQMFPLFTNPPFSDAQLQMYWTMGTSYISDVSYGWLQGVDRQLALNLLTAHLTQLSVVLADNKLPYVIQGSGIDKINVTLTPPKLQNQWRWWLQTTGYGMQLLALLQARSVGGLSVGGLPELAAFRRVGGVFYP